MKRRFSPHIPAKTKRTTPDVYGYTSNDDESSDDESSNDESSDDDNDEEEPSEELSQLFEESDSDSTGSFEVSVQKVIYAFSYCSLIILCINTIVFYRKSIYDVSALAYFLHVHTEKLSYIDLLTLVQIGFRLHYIVTN